MTVTTSANTVRVACGDKHTTLEAPGVFVSIDLTGDVAYLVHDCDTTLRWREISRADVELLLAMGAHAQVAMESAPKNRTVPRGV